MGQTRDRERMSESLTPEKLKLIRQIVMLTDGLDPEEQTILKELLKVDHIQEKTNFPAAIIQQKQTYLKMCVETLKKDPNYGKELSAPFEKHAQWDATTWRSYKGFTPNNQMEILKSSGQDLAGLVMTSPQQGQPQTPPKKRFWQRSKGEGEQLEP
jgi:hypothetical protein